MPPIDMAVPLDYSTSTTPIGQNYSPITPSTSWDYDTAFDPNLSLSLSDEEWLKFVDFNNSAEAANWEAFDVSFAELC